MIVRIEDDEDLYIHSRPENQRKEKEKDRQSRMHDSFRLYTINILFNLE